MMKRIASFLLLVVLLTGGVAPVGLSGSASALRISTVTYSADAKGDACAGIGLAGGGCGDNGAQVNRAISVIVNLLAAVVGVTAVIMIIISGFKFMTASGDPSSISSAKRSIIYALVGLVIAASAETIVHFFLTNAA